MTNVRSIPDATIEPDQDGITSLHGPIGAGKSTILTALVWCLYGEVGGVPGLLAQSEMRRRGTTDPVSVEVEFTHAGSRFIARRSLRRGKRGKETAYASLSIDGVRQPSISPTKLTQQITQRTGLTGRAFVGAFFIAQGNLPALAEGTPAEVQRLIEEQTGLAPLTKAVEQARVAARDAQVRADAMPGSLDAVSAAQADLDDAQSAAADRWPVLEAANTAVTTAQDREDQTRTRHEALQQQAAAARDAQVRSAQARRDLEHATARLADLQKELQEVDPAEGLDQLAATRDALGRGADTVAAALAAVDHQRDNLNTARARAASAAAARTSLPEPPEDVGALEAALDQAKEEKASARAEWTRLAETTRSLQQVRDHQQCPTCAQQLDDPRSLITALTAQMESVADRGKGLARRVDDLASKVNQAHTDHVARRDADRAAELATEAQAQAERDLAAAQNGLTATTQALTRLLPDPTPTNPVDMVSQARDQAARLTEQIATARRAEHLHQQLAATRQDADQARADLAAGQHVSAPSPEDLAAAADENATARQELATARQQHTTVKSELDVLLERARAAEATRDQQQKLLDARADADEEADTKRHAHGMLVELRKELVAEYTATISAAASDLMAQVGGGGHVGVTIGADFVPRVVLTDGTTRAMRVLSGGEKMRAALCLRLGIAEQISGVSGEGMIFADEITASHDADTTTAVVEMMRALGRPMVVVAHADQVQQIATKVYNVTKPSEEQGATVTTAKITPPAIARSGA